MASGGMGDVLTGVCAALAPQMREKNLFQSAVLGAWLCGRSAEIAVFEPLGSAGVPLREFGCQSSWRGLRELARRRILAYPIRSSLKLQP